MLNLGKNRTGLKNILHDIFQIKDERTFNEVAIKTFNHQYRYVSAYQKFIDALRIDVNDIVHYSEIPFMPIEFFKNHSICDQSSYETIFTSSGTTGQNTSKHYVVREKLYQDSFLKAFELFYGKPENYCFIGLLPSYMEREGSSLIYMVDHLIKNSAYSESQFSLSPTEQILDALKDPNIPCFVIGVTYAILDLAEDFSGEYPNTIFLETGGMKGTRKELTKTQIHDFLIPRLGVRDIHSEYGMTELLSQAYSKGKGLFECPPWMKVLVREVDDPLTLRHDNRTGGMNIIDLANFHSCSFIATQDLGRVHENGSFEVMGRFDYSDVRGCNLLVQ